MKLVPWRVQCIKVRNTKHNMYTKRVLVQQLGLGMKRDKTS